MQNGEAEVLPRRFGNYTLLRLLASGGMGAVYLATSGEAGMEKFLALKVVLPELAGSEFARRFRDEAKVVVKLSHGNLVQVFDAGQVDGEAYLAMEFVEGHDLRTLWNHCVEQRVAFPLEVIWQIVKDALRGLHYAHSYRNLNLVHRDISPPNLMVTYFGEVKITDFGLAASSAKTEKTRPGLVYGKIPYMAPEQARGETLDPRADLYPLGVILWELLTGRRLFPPSGDASQDLAARAQGPPVPAPSEVCARVPAALDGPVLRALHPDREKRFADAAAMQKALSATAADLWPGVDTDRVAAFMQTLFGDQIPRERARRQALLEKFRSAQTTARNDDSSLSEATTNPLAAEAERVRVQLDGSDSGTLLANKYRLGRMLGEGGMGQVFEAVHADLGKRVAIKILHKVFSRTPEARERFRREARAATRIDHRAVVDVLDFGTSDDGRCFYVMELLEGLSLADLLDLSSPVELERALELTVQLCDAIQAAHRAGVIHRDLKPENVMICQDSGKEQIKILDFGIARQLDPPQNTPSGKSLTKPGATLGTPEYMAPEQAAGQPVDERADIYAVCALLYEMLTGTPPHTAATPQEVLLRKLQYPAVDITQQRADLDPQLSALIMTGLDSSPEKRPQKASLIAARLEAILRTMRQAPADAATSAPIDAPVVDPAAPKSRHPVAVARQKAARPVPGADHISPAVQAPAPVGFAPDPADGAQIGLSQDAAREKKDWDPPAPAGAAPPSAASTAASTAAPLERASRARNRSQRKTRPPRMYLIGTIGLCILMAGAAGGVFLGRYLSARKTKSLQNGKTNRSAARNTSAQAEAPANQKDRLAQPFQNRPHAGRTTTRFAGIGARKAAVSADADETAPARSALTATDPSRSPSDGADTASSQKSSRFSTARAFSARTPPADGPRPRAEKSKVPMQTRTRPPSARALVRRGRRLMAQGKHRAAEKLFMRARSSPGGRVLGLTALAELAFQSKRYTEAVHKAMQAVKSGGGLRAKMVAGNSYYRLGLYRAAIKQYKSVLAIRPNNRSAKRALRAAQKKLGTPK